MEMEIFKMLGGSVIASVFFFFLLMLWKKLKEKDELITSLNKEIISFEKDSILALNKLSDAVTQMKDILLVVLKKEKLQE